MKNSSDNNKIVSLKHWKESKKILAESNIKQVTNNNLHLKEKCSLFLCELEDDDLFSGYVIR